MDITSEVLDNVAAIEMALHGRRPTSTKTEMLAVANLIVKMEEDKETKQFLRLVMNPLIST